MNNVSAAGGEATFDTDDPTKVQVVDGSSSRNKSISLCPELEQFYRAHNLDVSQLLLDSSESTTTTTTSRPWRFVRLNPRFDRAETLTLIEQELLQMYHNVSNEHKNSPGKTHLTTTTTTKAPIPVPWLDSKQWGFYALPGNFSLASSPCFRSGRLYGMDISSGASIAALLTTDHDRELQDSDNDDNAPSSADDNCQAELRVLDLCTCPGLKLLTMADYFYQHHQKNAVALAWTSVKPLFESIGWIQLHLPLRQSQRTTLSCSCTLLMVQHLEHPNATTPWRRVWYSIREWQWRSVWKDEGNENVSTRVPGFDKRNGCDK
jgi:hypothetical protein